MTQPSEAQSPPQRGFDDLALSDEARRAIDEIGWSAPTAVQLATFDGIAEGKDLVIQSQTGTGKTAAFGIPIVDRIVRPEPKLQALVLAPTRELALQSQRELERIGRYKDISVAAVYGGAPMDPQIQRLREGVQVVSGTPGRVLDHMKRGTLDPSALRVLVLDEADEILSMGFAKELNAILARLPGNRQTLLFSATADDDIREIGERNMRDPEYVTLSGDAVGALGVSHYVYLVGGTGRVDDLTRILEVEDPENAIIFCNTRAETERVASRLQQQGFDGDWLNGDLPQGEREKLMDRTRKGELRYLVATDVAARGIDVSHLTHVINYEFPPTPQQYIHRTGRTGRAGRTGTAISLVSPLELATLYFLRLQYKIVPVERSLPTGGEERTRKEADRIRLLEEAFAATPDELDQAVARRLLTHADAERILAGLLGAFFGRSEQQTDEQAAAARRARRPRPDERDGTGPPRQGGGRRKRKRRNAENRGKDDRDKKRGSPAQQSKQDGDS